MTIRWLHGATLALRAIHSHVAVENPDAARRVVNAVRLATVRLGEFPASGRPGTVCGTREIIVPSQPYVVVYRIVGNDVETSRTGDLGF